MIRLRTVLLLVLSLVAVLIVAPGAALADSPAPGVPVCTSTPDVLNGLPGALGLADGTQIGTVSFSQSDYTADEDAGQFWLTITRTSTSGIEDIGYGVKQDTAQSPWDFLDVDNSEAVLVPGQASCQFPVTITNTGMNGPSVAALAYLYGSSRSTLVGGADNVPLTILRNDPMATRDPANPLDLPVAPTDGDPLSGAQFYVAPASVSGAGKAAMQTFRTGDSADAKALAFIAEQPTASRFWLWKTPADPAPEVTRFLETAEDTEPGKVVELSTYSLVHSPCASTANSAFTTRYLNWVRGLAQGIGNTRVVMFFELDSLITAPCLTPAERHIRLDEQLRPAIQILEAADPRLVLYLDAGASDALPAAVAANYLRQAGVGDAQGFFLNSTHFQWDTTEIQYGQKISRLLGGRTHFVISSAVNGRGPLLNAHPETEGVEQLCNPVNRGLGTMSTQTGYTNLDGLLWLGQVGNSGGACRAGAPPTATFWPAYAISLYEHRDFAVTGPRLDLSRSGSFAPYSAAFDW